MQNTRIKMRNKHKNKRRKRRGMTKKWKSKSLGYRYALPEASLLESTSRRRGFRKGRDKKGGGEETPCHPHNCAATCGLCGRFCPLSVCIFCRQTNFQLNICALVVVVVVAAATRAAAAATRNGLEFKINAI